jgi:glycosyltransferase involved in cell wall biosynthesis
MPISVVVATRNRAQSIAACVGSLATAALEDVGSWELIVVDNGSTDGTAALVADLGRRHALSLRYILEERVGVSAARNAGIRAARYPIIAFTDDDCVLDASWLGGICRAFAADPTLGVVCGRVDLYDGRDAPIAIRPYADRQHVTSLAAIRARGLGCNMAIARTVIDDVGGFDESFGPGTWCSAAEDHELYYRALRANHKIVFDPEIRIRHAHGRRDPQVVDAIKRHYARGYGALLGKYIRRGDRLLWKAAYWEVRAHCLDAAKRRSLLGEFGHAANFLYGLAGKLFFGSRSRCRVPASRFRPTGAQRD